VIRRSIKRNDKKEEQRVRKEWEGVKSGSEGEEGFYSGRKITGFFFRRELRVRSRFK